MNRLAALLLTLLCLGIPAAADGPNAPFDLAGFARLPVVFNGRHQPMDSVARNSLVQIRDRYSLYDLAEKRSVPASEWMAEVMMRPAAADQRKAFRLDHPDLISLLKLPQKDEDRGEDGKHYSWNQLEPGFKELDDQAKRILEREDPRRNQRPTDPSQRTTFEQSVLKLRNALTIYLRLKNTIIPGNTTNLLADVAEFRATGERFATNRGETAVRSDMVSQIFHWDTVEGLDAPLILPPAEVVTNREGWQRVGGGVLSLSFGDLTPDLLSTLGDIRRIAGVQGRDTEALIAALRQRFNDLLDRAGPPKPVPAALVSYVKMADAFRGRDAAGFNSALADYRQQLASNPAVAADQKKANREVLFNRLAPFYTAMPLYVGAFLLACFHWFNFSEWARKTAFALVGIAFVIHTTGLLFRMFLEGRPPVTNLYSSAIFIGWGAVVLGIVLEKFWRNAIGLVVASAIGFTTLVVAHNLALGGDTMVMLQAVLDTNFWLATHVVIVTLGYASTYVAGFLAIIYVLRGVFTRSLDEATGKSLARMTYGIICFATLFSFIGTVLGGIWADQSWGRFWGWDPKENGALIIVLWNVLILHARLGGLVRERGLMNLAIAGNIVTSWSWFGTNMLGIGLHSYGFMSGAFMWLLAFVGSQLALIGLGLLPPQLWRSYRAPGATPPSLPPTSGRKSARGGKPVAATT